MMAEPYGADDDLEEVASPRLELGQLRSNRSGELALQRAPLFHAKDVEPYDPLVETLVRFVHPRREAHEVWDGGVRAREQMVVDLESAAIVDLARAEVVRLEPWHVAAVAVRLGRLRVVEARDAVSRNAG